MNRFANPTPEARLSPLQPHSARPALTVFLCCLLLGAAGVTWRTIARADNARARVRTEARAQALALEAQFNQAIAAAEVLGALARQSGGGIPNFRQVASELHASRPGLATLELQPGGVVSDIVPPAGFERAIGFNVFAHPTYQAGAQAALQTRQLTLSGPLPLYHGEPGFVARMPVFQRTRDGREVCWGFVAVSLGLQEALTRARLDALAAQGYDYLLFTPAIAGQRAATIAKQGQNSFARAEQQTVRAQNLEFRLAVQPRRGWVSWGRIAVEGLGVLGVSALAGLLVLTVQQGRGLGAALAESEIRLARVTAEGKQAREELQKAQETVGMTRAQHRQAEQIIAPLKECLETTTRSAQEIAAADCEKLRQAEATIAALQGQVESSARAAMETAEPSPTQLAQAAATIEELQVRLDASHRQAQEADEAAQARLKKKDQAMADLQSRLEAADHQAKESAKASATRLRQSEQTITDLQIRLEAAMREVQASSANLQEAEKTIAELASKQRAAERTEAAVADLIHPPEESARPAQGSSPESSAAASDAPSAAVSLRETDLSVPPHSESVPVQTVGSHDDLAGRARLPSSPDSIPHSIGARQESRPPESRSRLRRPEVESPAPSQPATAVPGASPPAAPAAPALAAKPAKRKKARLDLQMSLFAKERPAAETASAGESRPPSAEPPSAPVAPEPAAAEPSAPAQVPDAETGRTEEKRAPVRPLPPSPPVNLSQLRKAVSEMLPLLTGHDPGAKDCLKDNRTPFRSAFSPEGFVEFEQTVKGGDYAEAAHLLRKAARKHGLSA